ncbi:hypothetical protein Y032_0111g231 [Ancylostoma ceylanicum]|uniref:Uncharacterized protein n=1 Tax=Ancylostoma ceylanicum TaxID=53326 RepID=A0A016TED3_9BILA|nr:hypothetical protein Y032_0111g231 [Ancylostoma ceylanicum]
MEFFGSSSSYLESTKWNYATTKETLWFAIGATILAQAARSRRVFSKSAKNALLSALTVSLTFLLNAIICFKNGDT